MVNELLCAILGHTWVPAKLLHWEPGIWSSDELCSRCGVRRWWPQ